MTKNEIIGELFTSKDFVGCIKKMRPENLQEDLKSEVILVLLEKDEEVIQELYRIDKLKFYTVRIILNMIQSKTSPFYKKFRSFEFGSQSATPEHWVMDALTYAESVDGRDINTRFVKSVQAALINGEDYDTKHDEAIAQIENLYWYDREIMKLYAEHGTYRKIEDVTGIPWESVYKTIQRSCKIIRKKVA